MGRLAKQLSGRLSTVFSDYAPQAFEASEAAEQRLAELEQRDRARQERDNRKREAIRDQARGR